MKKIAKLAGATMAVQLFTVATQLLMDIIVARNLGPEKLGMLVLGLSIAGLLSVFLLFGSGEIAMRMYGDDAYDNSAVLSGAWKILLRGVGVMFALGGLACAIIGTDAHETAIVVMALFVLLVNGFSSTLGHAIVALDRSKEDLVGCAISRVVMLALASIAAWNGSVIGVLLAYMAGALSHAFLRVRLVDNELFRVRWNPDQEVFERIWSEGKHIGIGSIFGTISNRADTLVISALTTPHVTGLYGAAYRFVTGAQVFSQASSFALYPFLTRGTQQERGSAKKIYVALAIAGAIFWCGVAFFAEILINLVYGAQFVAAAPILRVLLFAVGVQWLAAYVTRWMIAMGRQSILPYAQAVGCAVNLISLAVLIPGMAGVGAAWATLLADAAVVIILGLVLLFSVQASRSQNEAATCPDL